MNEQTSVATIANLCPNLLPPRGDSWTKCPQGILRRHLIKSSSPRGFSGDSPLSSRAQVTSRKRAYARQVFSELTNIKTKYPGVNTPHKIKQQSGRPTPTAFFTRLVANLQMNTRQMLLGSVAEDYSPDLNQTRCPGSESLKR